MSEGKKGHRGHPALWATLTVAVFPFVALSMGWLGYGPFQSFAAGAGATLLVLIVEAAARGRWWMADPEIARHLGDPRFGFRLLVVTGVIVLCFQSLVLVGLLASGGYDGNVVRFILTRQCASGMQDPLFSRLCVAATAARRADAATMAIRETAERRIFPSGFVTCAVRPLATNFTERSCTQTAHIRCDRWIVGKIAREPVLAESVSQTVAVALTLLQDGSYRVDGWNEDPSSPGWHTIATQSGFDGSAQPTTDSSALAQETYRRALERLQAR